MEVIGLPRLCAAQEFLFSPWRGWDIVTVALLSSRLTLTPLARSRAPTNIVVRALATSSEDAPGFASSIFMISDPGVATIMPMSSEPRPQDTISLCDKGSLISGYLGLQCKGMIARGFPPVSEEGKYNPLDFKPSSSSRELRFSRPVSIRRLLASGEIFGRVFPKTKQIDPNMTREIPRAIMGIEHNSRYDVGIRPTPAKSKPRPNSLYWFFTTNTHQIGKQTKSHLSYSCTSTESPAIRTFRE